MNEYMEGFGLFLATEMFKNKEQTRKILASLKHYAEAAEKAKKIREIGQRPGIKLGEAYNEIDKLGPFDTAVVLNLALKQMPVTQRDDQKTTKPAWRQHVEQCQKDGLPIINLLDLLDALDASNIHEEDKLKIKNTSASTLKKWAKEVPGIQFTGGRPKNR